MNHILTAQSGAAPSVEASSSAQDHVETWIAQSTNEPTRETYEAFQEAFRIFNLLLFGGILPECLVTLQRHWGTNGYFCQQRFVNKSGTVIDEIALNPMYFAERTETGVLSTLVHEMAHLWRFHFGKRNRNGEPGRRGYHCHEWGKRMRDIGLQPSHTGQPGGRVVGYQMTHYIIEGGPFETVTCDMIRDGFELSWADRSEIAKTSPPASGPKKEDDDGSNRWKYTCPVCRLNAWAKPAALLHCGSCHVLMPRGVRRSTNP